MSRRLSLSGATTDPRERGIEMEWEATTPSEKLAWWRTEWNGAADRISVKHGTLTRLLRTAMEQNGGHASGVPVPRIVKYKGGCWAVLDEDAKLLRRAQPTDYRHFWNWIADKHPEILAAAHSLWDWRDERVERGE